MDRSIIPDNYIELTFKEKKNDVYNITIIGPKNIGKTYFLKQLIRDINTKSYIDLNKSDSKSKIPKSKVLCFDNYKKENNKKYNACLKKITKRTKYIIKAGDIPLNKCDFNTTTTYYIRLYPFTVKELKIETERKFKKLLNCGGFPKLFRKNNENLFQINQYMDLSLFLKNANEVITIPGNIKDSNPLPLYKKKNILMEYYFKYIKQIINKNKFYNKYSELEKDIKLNNNTKIIIFFNILVAHVGKSLSSDIINEYFKISINDFNKWFDYLVNNYFITKIEAFKSKKIRSNKKEEILYLYQWALASTNFDKLENLLVMHLLKEIHYYEDVLIKKLKIEYNKYTEKLKIIEDKIINATIRRDIIDFKNEKKNFIDNNSKKMHDLDS